jgi:membrane fusion protein, multidrug efflux system
MHFFFDILKHLFIFVGMGFFVSACTDGTTEKASNLRKPYEEQVNEVEVAVLERGVFNKEIVSNGKLKAFRKSDLTFKVSGELKIIRVRNGQAIDRTQTIAELDQFEYRQRLEHAEVNVKRTSIELKDELILYGGSKFKEDSFPPEIYEGAAIRSGYLTALTDLKTAQLDLDATILKAPFSGKVANLKYNAYETINTGEVFCTIIDDSKFEVEFYLLESEINEVALQDKITIVPFSRSITFNGVISEINPLVDENGLVLVKAAVTNNGTLWEGMNVKVFIQKQEFGHLIVPKSAVVMRQNQEVLFKYINGAAYWTYVITGLENSSYYSVLGHRDKGGVLQEGDTIIISNNLNLAHETKVKLKSEGD